MLKHLLCLALLAGVGHAAANTAIAPVPPHADFRVSTIQVRIAPDHRDWTYRLGEPVKFRITVTADNTPVDNATVTYSVGPEMMPVTKQTAAVPLEGLVIDGGTLQTGGFIRCKAAVEFAGRTYQGVATAAYAPETIQPFQTEPADFDAFWQKGKEDLAKIPMEARLTLLLDACTDTVNVYHVNFRTVGQAWNPTPPRIYGILTEPKAPGKYPAVLKVPGAGVRSYAGDTALAARGAIVLEIGIHGIPVNLTKEVYDAMYGGALHSYWVNQLDNRDAYYYRRVYLGCLRSNDFLTSREMWDGKNLLVMGASQGGQLSLVTAGLDPRVTALSAIHPAMCDIVAPLHGRAGGWPHPFRPAENGSPSVHATPAKIATSAYYDSVNFARRIKVPGFYIWGFNDETCPPTSTFAAYNVITAPKTLAVEPEQAHTYPVEQGEAVNRWVVSVLNLK
ncbi:MAG TPA: acetylxylan esterase [Lacunisphaera sp.]|nr:acetylxylan esterase [Lacunisphaera sp.]